MNILNRINKLVVTKEQIKRKFTRRFHPMKINYALRVAVAGMFIIQQLFSVPASGLAAHVPADDQPVKAYQSEVGFDQSTGQKANTSQQPAWPKDFLSGSDSALSVGSTTRGDSALDIPAVVSRWTSRATVTREEFNALKIQDRELFQMITDMTYEEFLSHTHDVGYARFVTQAIELGLSIDRERFLGLIEHVEHLIFIPNPYEGGVTPSFANGETGAVVTTFEFDLEKWSRQGISEEEMVPYFLTLFAHEAKHLQDWEERPDLYAADRLAEIEYRAWAEDFYFSRDYLRGNRRPYYNIRAFINTHGPDQSFQGPVGKIFVDYDMGHNQNTLNQAVRPVQAAVARLAQKHNVPDDEPLYVNSTVTEREITPGTMVRGYDFVFQIRGQEYQIFADMEGNVFDQMAPAERLTDFSNLTEEEYQYLLGTTDIGESIRGAFPTYEDFVRHKIDPLINELLQEAFDVAGETDPESFATYKEVIDHILILDMPSFIHGNAKGEIRMIAFNTSRFENLNSLTSEERQQLINEIIVTIAHEGRHNLNARDGLFQQAPNHYDFRIGARDEETAYRETVKWMELLG